MARLRSLDSVTAPRWASIWSNDRSAAAFAAPARPALDASQTPAIVAATAARVSAIAGQLLPLCLVWALPPTIVPACAMVDASNRIGGAVGRPVDRARRRTPSTDPHARDEETAGHRAMSHIAVRGTIHFGLVGPESTFIRITSPGPEPGRRQP